MAVELLARRWERPVTGERPKRADYSAGWTSIVQMLRGELRNVGARSAIIEMDVQERDIRNDGWLRGDSRPGNPGVRCSFTCQYGPLVYECCTWMAWEHNIYAVARTLRAQRMIQKDGAVKGDQVYRGFKALPGGERAPLIAGEFSSTEDAARHLLRTASYADDAANVRAVCERPEKLREVWVRASQRVHPDTMGGSAPAMARVNAAKEFIETKRTGGAA